MYSIACRIRSSSTASGASSAGGTGGGTSDFFFFAVTARGRRRPSVHLDALFLEVLLRARMERDRRADRLALELDVLRLLVHGDELGLVLEQRLHDRVRHLRAHARV